jgi:hypothetical protein
LTTIRRSCARRSRRCLGSSLGESRPILRHFNVSRRPRGIPEVAHRAPAVTPREEVAERLTVTTTRPCQIGETTTSLDELRQVPLTVGTRAMCRFPTGLTSVFSLACRTVILAKVSESAQHSGRSAAGVTGKVRAAPPVPRMRRAHPEPRGAPGTVAGAVGELGDDAGIGEWVHVAACVAGRYAQLALEQLCVDHGAF